MRQVTRKVRKVVQRLTDAQPSRVSLVGHGANQTPWNVVKSADPASQENTMKTRIHRIDFAAAKFPDLAAAQAFMTDKGYEGAVVRAVEAGGFAVDGHKADVFQGTIEQIVRDEGVTMHVGTLTDEAEAAAVAEDEKVAKEAETVEATPETTVDGDTVFTVKGDTALVLAEKWNGYCAEWSNETTIAGVMAEGLDGLPPGIYEVNTAFYAALKNTLLAKNVDGVQKLCEEFGSLIVKMAKTFSAATLPKEVVAKAVDKLFQDPAVEPSVPVVITAAQDEGTAPGSAPEGETAAKAGETPEATPGETASEPAAKETVEPAPEPAQPEALEAVVTKAIAPFAEMVAKSLASMADAVTGLATSAKETATKTEAAIAGVTEEVTKAAVRVSALEDVRQSRKGADANHTAAGTQPAVEQPKSDDQQVVRRQALGSSLGLLRPRG